MAAATESDEKRGTAWVLARCPLRRQKTLRTIYACLGVQGVVDFFVFERYRPGILSQRCMKWAVCVDLSRAYEEHGWPPDPFPRFCVQRSAARRTRGEDSLRVESNYVPSFARRWSGTRFQTPGWSPVGTVFWCRAADWEGARARHEFVHGLDSRREVDCGFTADSAMRRMCVLSI